MGILCLARVRLAEEEKDGGTVRGSSNSRIAMTTQSQTEDSGPFSQRGRTMGNKDLEGKGSGHFHPSALRPLA